MQKSISLVISDFLIQRPVDYKEFRRRQYNKAGIPSWVHDLTITKNYIVPQHRKPFNRFVDNIEESILNGTGVILYSKNVGVGKSSYLFSLAKKAIDHGFIGYCFYYPDLLSLFKETQTDGKLKMEFKHSIQDCDFVLVDDLGCGHIVSRDYSKFKQFMTESAMTRIISNSLFVELSGDDIRLQNN